MEYALGIGLAYLLGLAILGYVNLLLSLKLIGKALNWNKLATNGLIAFHFILGISAILVLPALFLRYFKSLLMDGGQITFAIIGFLMLGVVFTVASYWNRILALTQGTPPN